MKYADMKEAQKRHKELKTVVRRLKRDRTRVGSDYERTEIDLRLGSAQKAIKEIEGELQHAWENKNEIGV